MLKSGDKIGIVCCSDGLESSKKSSMDRVEEVLNGMGLVTVKSPFLYRKKTISSGTGQERARIINEMYQDRNIKAVFDVSGGNLANEVLEYLDYDLMKKEENRKEFWGYSDLTVILNALYTKCGQTSWLYQIQNLAGEYEKEQTERFRATVYSGEGNRSRDDLQPDKWHYLQGERMSGVLVGGNIRCFLKLAGTEYFPDVEHKILFLEGFGGGEGVISSLLTQLRLMGVFGKIDGLLLGTFTQLDGDEGTDMVERLVLESVADPLLPVARTLQVGHGKDSRALHIGSVITI